MLARDNASSTFRSVGDSAERAGKQTSGFGTQMAGAMKVAAGALLGAGLIEGFKALYQAADESRKIAALTTQVIKSTGGAANVSAQQVGALAGAIAKKTGVDDEAIQSGQNLLLTFTNVKNAVGSGNDIFNQATKIMTDMSVALGTDASGSAIQLGKALNDPIKGVSALQRVGVSFTASQKEQIKTLVETGDTLGAQKIILQELNKEFGGAAEAAATPLAKLQQRLGDLAEEMGGHLLPLVDKAATYFMDHLMPALSDIGSIVGSTVLPTFKAIATIVGGAVDVFNALPGPLQAGVVAFGAYLALRGPLTTLFSNIGDAATNMALKMASNVGAVGGFKAAAGGLLGVLGGPWGLAITGATVGLSLLVDWLGKSDTKTVGLSRAQRSLTDAINATNGALDESVRRAAAKALQDQHLLDFTEQYGVSSQDMVGYVLGESDAHDKVSGALQRYRAALEAKLTGDKEADIVTQGLIGAVDIHQKALDGLAGTTSVQVGKQAELTQATETGAVAQQTFAQMTKDSRDALDEAKQAIDDYKLSLDILTGQSVSMIQVEASLNDAISAGKDAMDKLGGSVLDASGKLNLQSENGRKAADVLLDVRNSGNELISTMIQQGATADVVQAKDAALRASFINTANQMGITGANAEALADQILGIPGQRSTTITADTSQASGAVDALVDKIRNAGGRIIYTGADVKNTTGASARAAGGIIHGPGTGTSDSILGRDASTGHPTAWVSAGEYVVNKRSTDTYRPLIEAINAGRLATGGPVLGGAYQVPVGLTDSTLSALERKLTPTFSGGPAGAGVQRWLPLVLQMLGMLGQPSGLAQTVLRRMQQESGGNPGAINNWDINAKRGTPSKGLMQVIDPTFRAYAYPGYNKNVYDPLSNLLASGRYAISRYGSLAAAYNKAGGYELGTDWVPETGPYVLHKGEAVVPAAANSGWTGGNLSGLEITGTLEVGGDGLARIVNGQIVAALTGVSDRRRYNG